MLTANDQLPEKVFFWMSGMIILYGYLGYPIALNLLVKYYKKPVQTGEITPDVTLLVCAYNEEDVIRGKNPKLFGS